MAQDTLRGQACIIGIGDLPRQRSWPGKSALGLCSEAAKLAIEDAGLTKEHIDGLVCIGGAGENAGSLKFYMGLGGNFAIGNTMGGCSPLIGLTIAASLVSTGMANYVLGVYGAERDEAKPGPRLRQGWSLGQEWEDPYGAYTREDPNLAFMYARHMYEYGTTAEQMASFAVNTRFNALSNPRAVMAGEGAITVQDVLNSPEVISPLRRLECAPAVGGACAFVVAAADRALAAPHPPVYLLGVGAKTPGDVPYLKNEGIDYVDPRLTLTPTAWSAREACEMAGYAPREMQLIQFHDRNPILAAACIEDAGFCRKGEAGPFLAATDTTYRGTLPINTDGGQLSGGRLDAVQGASGAPHIMEAVRQLMGRAESEGRQVADASLCMINLCGDGLSKAITVVLGTEETL